MTPATATAETAPRPRPVQQVMVVTDNEPAGTYRRLVLSVDPSAVDAADREAVVDQARPGQFVALATGDVPTATLLRRSFSLHRAGEGSVEVVVAAHGPGSAWITRRRPGDLVDVVGPLGRPFPWPPAGADAVLVGGGYGSAPMTWFAQLLAEHGVGVRTVIGAADAGRLFGVAQCQAYGPVRVTTDDGSAGTRGRVTDVLGEVATGADTVVYACGPMPMLRAVTQVAAGLGVPAWVTVEEAMACGIGVCMTCVLPVVGSDGRTRMTRACTQGPTFAGSSLRWDAIGAGPSGTGSLVPIDCLGAPAAAGH